MLTIGMLVLLAFQLFSACKKKESTEEIQPEPTSGTVSLKLSYNVDGASLLFDTIHYVNQAGNQYSISKLVYYLSNISFKNANGNSYETKAIKFIDAQNLASNQFSFDGIPNGDYTSIGFLIGIDSLHNQPNGLPANTDNLSMEWPIPMGGGYHFLRLEGYYRDSCCTPGYAMHLGTNACLISVNIPHTFSIAGNTVTMQMKMNVSEWFKNPASYDFNTDGNFSMGNAAAMQKLRQNGVDVFNF